MVNQRDRNQLILDFQKLFVDKHLRVEGHNLIIDINELSLEPTLLDFFIEEPEDFIKIVDEVCMQNHGKVYHKKIENLSFIEDISNIRKKHINKLVKLRGTISRSSKSFTRVKSRKFECKSCGSLFTTQGEEPQFKCSCGSKNSFKKIETEYEDIISIEVEENQDEIDGNKQPQKIRILLKDKLTKDPFTEIIIPGTKVDVIGVVKLNLMDKSKIKDEEFYEFQIIAVDIDNQEESFDDKITDEDEKVIMEICADNPLEKLANSVAPNIFGYEEIKRAIILQMVGGTKKEKQGGNMSRDKIHILMMGDGSKAKTQFLKNVLRRIPKSYYVSGDKASQAGLISMVEKDEVLGTWGLKGGAIVKANGSVLLLDEIDKISKSQLNSLHEPLEDGKVTVSKAGINASLNADCGLLAAGNPKYGMFDLHKPISEQIDIPGPLMTRFDLIFVMYDKMDEEEDRGIVDAIFKQAYDEDLKILDIPTFRKYIIKARKVKPRKLTKELVEDLKEFYVKIRNKSKKCRDMRAMTISPRHLEGIERMAVASAKIRLSEKVEKEDLDLAKKLFEDTLIKLGMEEDGSIDFARIGGGTTLNKKTKMEEILKHIRKATSENKGVLNKDIYQFGDKLNMNPTEVDEVLESLHKETQIFHSAVGWKSV